MNAILRSAILPPFAGLVARSAQSCPPAPARRPLRLWLALMVGLLGGFNPGSTAHAAVAGRAIITVQPLTATVNAGNHATLRVTATSATTLSYQWRRNGVALAGATNATLNISAASPADAGVYTVLVTNAAGTVTSRAALLTVIVPPSITDQPDDEGVTPGRAAVFRAGASGSAVLLYQWEMAAGGGSFVNVTNGPHASGATSATLVYRETTLASSGTRFRVRVTNIAGVAVSENATLNVGVIPAIVSPPVSASVVAGGNATFSVTANGTGALRYQWRRNGVNIAGATSSTLTVNGVATSDLGAYSVVVSNDFGATASTAVALRTAVPPAIVVEPQDAAVVAGVPVAFSVRATGSARLHFQWQVMTEGAPGFANLASTGTVAGTTSAVLVLRRPTADDSGNVYRVVVTNDVGTDISANATLQVGTRPVITEQPQNTQVVAGGTVTLSAEATGTAPLNFQWLLNGRVLTGETGASLTIAGAAATDQGLYRVVVRNAFGVTVSQTARVTLGAAPAVVDQPDDTGVIAGRAAVFRVRATGSARLLYQWQISNGEGFENLANGAAAAGVNTAVLVYRGTTLSANGTAFRVVVTNNLGVATSADATLTVGAAPVITTAPQPLTVVAGAAASLSVAATGTGPLQYQWLRNNIAISGATGTTLNLSPADAGDTGVYSVRITNGVGVALSRAVRVVVTPAPQGVFVGGFVGAGARSGMAALVQADGHAVVLGFNDEHDEGLLAANADVALNGSFSSSTSQGGSVHGTVGARSLVGTFVDGRGSSENFTGVRRPDAGAHAASAGYYVGIYEGDDSGEVFAIVAADGSAFFYFISSETNEEGGAFVRIAANGNASGVILPALVAVRGALNSATTTITGTYGLAVAAHGTFTLHRVLGP